MTIATEVLGPAHGGGLLMSKSGYTGSSKIGSDNSHAIYSIYPNQRNPNLVFPFFASGFSAYEWSLGLDAGHSPVPELDVASWESLTSGANRVSGPVQFVLKLLDNWRLSRDDAVPLLGFDQADNGFVKAVLTGAADLHGRDVRDRIAHLFHIRGTLSSFFRDLDVENQWLRESHVLLEDQEPLNLLLGGSMEDLLLVKEYVDAAAGR